MSLSVIDYNLPIAVETLAFNPQSRQLRMVRVVVEWKHILYVLEEGFPEEFDHKLVTTKGICTLGTMHGVYTAVGSFETYFRSWMGYKNWLKKEQNKFKFYLPSQ